MAEKETRRGNTSGARKSRLMPSARRSTSGNWWPYAIGGGVLVLVAAFVAVTQFGNAGSGDAGATGAGLAVGAQVPTDSVLSSSGRTASLADLRGSKVVVYFYEGGA